MGQNEAQDEHGLWLVFVLKSPSTTKISVKQRELLKAPEVAIPPLKQAAKPTATRSVYSKRILGLFRQYYKPFGGWG